MKIARKSSIVVFVRSSFLSSSDFVTCQTFQYSEQGVYISALEHCRKIKLSILCSSDTHIHIIKCVMLQ